MNDYTPKGSLISHSLIIPDFSFSFQHNLIKIKIMSVQNSPIYL